VENRRAPELQPDERADRRGAPLRETSSRSAEHSTTRRSRSSRSGAASGWFLKKPNPFPKSILRKHRLRAPGSAGEQEEPSGPGGRTQPARSRAVGRGERPPPRERRSGSRAAKMQRLCIGEGDRQPPESPPAWPEPCSALDPIATVKVEELIHELRTGIHNRHCHPQHAAGDTLLGQDRLLLPRRDCDLDTPEFAKNLCEPRSGADRELAVAGRFG